MDEFDMLILVSQQRLRDELAKIMIAIHSEIARAEAQAEADRQRIEWAQKAADFQMELCRSRRVA